MGANYCNREIKKKMYLRKIEIKNYRLWKEATIELEQGSTVIVGKNNTGKTSFIDIIQRIIKNAKISFNDYPLNERKSLYENIKNYLDETITFEELAEAFSLPSVQFYIDYSLEDENESLGFLSPFIIDTDDTITEVKIEASYLFISSQEQFDSYFSKEILNDENPENKIKTIIEKEFTSIIKLVISTINPKDITKRRKIDHKEFENLLHVFTIKAERNMDESEVLNETPLRKIITSIFSPELDDASEGINEKKEELKKYCDTINSDTENKVNELLKNIVHDSLQFGYPAAEDHSLFAKSNIALEEQIKNSVDLFYKENETNEMLPSGYNGLGYKNLIKIELELLEYKNEIKNYINNSVPIIFIEEPESHMHPQMQQKFIQYIDSFSKTIMEGKNVQIIITTHSSHIVNSTKFEKIRYVTKENDSVFVKNLTEFCNEPNCDKDFLEKYLTLNKCDLFFADKAILIEGTAERLLIPNMIEKLDNTKKFKTEDITLKSQYYTLIEVGGAYAYKFIPLMQFLNIPTLIITDIDAVNADRKACLVNEGISSSNATIKHWFTEVLGKRDKQYSFEDIKKLSNTQKTSDRIHIEYQVEENNLCGRSLEEAIKNSNRKMFGISDNPEEKELEYSPGKDGSKTDFAMNLIFDVNKQNYNVPKYIEDGLIWLDSQLNGR